MGKSQGGSGSGALSTTQTLWDGGKEISASAYIAAMKVESDRIFGGSDFWILRESAGTVNGDGFHGSFAFSSGTRAFIGLGQAGNPATFGVNQTAIKEYTPSDNATVGFFTNVFNPFSVLGSHSVNYARASYFAADGRGYILASHRLNSGRVPIFYAYNIIGNTVVSDRDEDHSSGSLAVSPFIGTGFHAFSMFSLGDKVFVFGGSDYVSNHGLHIYVPATNSWNPGTSRLSSNPSTSIPSTGFKPAFDPLGDFYAPSSFVIDDVAYVQYGGRLIKITAQTEADGGVITMTSLHGLPVNRYFSSMFGRVNPSNNLDHEIYVIGGSKDVAQNPNAEGTVYKYSTLSGVWSNVSSYGSAFPPTTMGVAFTVKGRFFYGTGVYSASASNEHRIAEYIPLADNVLAVIPRTYARRDYDEITGSVRTNDELNGINGLLSRARTESPLVTAANTMFVNTFNFTANPKMDATFATRVAQITREFKRSGLARINRVAQSIGRYGGVSHYAILARQGEEVMQRITEAAKAIYMDDYDREMAIGMASLRLGLAYSNVAIKNAETLYRVGQMRREYEQGRLDDHYKRYHDAINRKSTGIEILGNAVRVFMGSHVVSTQPYYIPGKLSEIAGLALTGLAIIPAMKDGSGKDGVIDADTIRPKNLQIPKAPNLQLDAAL